MKVISTRFQIEYVDGANIFNTTAYEDLLRYIVLPIDSEGFQLKHLHVGVEFSLSEGELSASGNYKVMDILTYIQTEEQRIDNYTWNYHVIYKVEAV